MSDERAPQREACPVCQTLVFEREIETYIWHHPYAPENELTLCTDCREDYERETGNHMESADIIPQEEWLKLQEWIRDNKSERTEEPQKVWHANLETRHFSFNVYADTEPEAMRLIEAAWNLHMRNCVGHGGQEPEPFSFFADSVDCHEVELGSAYMDSPAGPLRSNHAPANIMKTIVRVICTLCAAASALYLFTWLTQGEMPEGPDWGKFWLALLVCVVSATIAWMLLEKNSWDALPYD